MVPNLVIVDCHDLGRHLGCYGQETVRTPGLDRIASDGVRFDACFANAPQCSPSRASLYTGRYPHATGMLGLAHAPFNWTLNDESTHLARILRDHGYETMLIGQQHVAPSRPDAVAALGYQQVWLLAGETAHSEIASCATDLLDQRREGQPFFLNIGLFEAHRDADGGYGYAGASRDEAVAVPAYLPDTAGVREELAELRAVVEQLDRVVMDVYELLERRGLLEGTLFVFTTDHGLAMPRAKCTLYDPGIAVALLMAGPALGLPRGRTMPGLVSHVDFVPTILDLLGVPIPGQVQGAGYAPALRGEAYNWADRFVFAEKTFHTAYEPQRAIRSSTHKLIWNAEVGIVNVPGDVLHSPAIPVMLDVLTAEHPVFELYDLRVDPDERCNLANDAAHASVKEDLRERLWHWMSETNDPLLQGPVASPFANQALACLMHGED
jgi:N-sulfoglucosamine sulfohydrolase